MVGPLMREGLFFPTLFHFTGGRRSKNAHTSQAKKRASLGEAEDFLFFPPFLGLLAFCSPLSSAAFAQERRRVWRTNPTSKMSRKKFCHGLSAPRVEANGMRNGFSRFDVPTPKADGRMASDGRRLAVFNTASPTTRQI